MKKKYLLGSGQRAARISRIIAKGIDFFIVLILAMFLYPLGIILAGAYLSISDSLQNGQSVGKKFIGFGVTSLEDGSPCSMKQSFIRNLPFLAPLAFTLIPVWGWFFSVVIGLPLMFLELYLLFKIDSGHRLGDVMADTTVIANDPHRKDIQAMTKKGQSWFSTETIPS